MANSLITSKQAKYGAYMSAYVIVIIGVLIAVNFLANRHDWSHDFTANKQFSLSEQTEKIAKNLKNDVTIYYFDDQQRFQTGKDLLDRYSSLSPKIHVKYIDPVRKKQEAQAAGYRRDVTVLVSSNGRNEEAKSNTEEEVTGALIRSQKSGERTVCYLTGAGEHSIDDEQANGFSLQKQLLERDNYKPKSITLKPGGAAPDATKQVTIGQAAPTGAVEVPKECLAVVIGGPQSDYPKPVVEALQKYVEGGGHALFMLDTPMRLGREAGASENADLAAVLAGWGVTLNKDLVLYPSDVGGMLGLGPEYSIITSFESHAITRPLRSPVAFPLPRSMDAKSAGKGTVDKLVATPEESISIDSIGPGGAVDPRKGKKGPHTIAAAGTISGTPQGRFVVVGTSGWAENRVMGSRIFGNRDFFMNTINWLTADEDLISIRPKQAEDRPLNMTGAVLGLQKMTLVWWLSIVLFPLAVVAFGLQTWWKRR
ncbi:MAG TPA: GldG family protein [Candidatus Solibacter sp.]|nr:GldG family protein [Candidatus Solibacter sp.]